MKVIFLSQDGEIEELVSSLGENVVLCEQEDQVLEELEEVEEDESCLLFLDFDDDKKSAEKFNKSIFKNEWITRILITSEMSVKELQKHQKGKTAAHGYVKKPLTKPIFHSILEDLNLSQFIEENEIFEEGQTLPEFGVKKAPASFGSQADLNDFEDDEEGAENTASDVFGASEFKMNTQVRNLVDLHSVSGDTPPYAGELNDKIQAKFDSVFERGELPDFEESSRPQEKSEEKIDLREESSSQKKSGDLSAPGISLDLGGEDESSDSSEDDGDLDFSIDEEGPGQESDEDELDLGEEEVLLSDDAEEEDDDDIDFTLDEEVESSADDSDELDFGSEDEISVDGEEEGNLDFSIEDAEQVDSEEEDQIEDIEPIQALSTEDLESELDELTQNRELPTPEELSEFEEETGDIEIPEELMAQGESPTPTPEAEPKEDGEDISMSDEEENDDILEFDENEEDGEDGELSFSTEPEEVETSEEEDEGGLDFDLGAIDNDEEDENILESEPESVQAKESDSDDGSGFDLDASLMDDDDEVDLEDPLAESSSEGSLEAGGVADLGALEEELGEETVLPNEDDLAEPEVENSEFEDDELSFSDDDEEELEKTQAINLADVEKMGNESDEESELPEEDDEELDLSGDDDLEEDTGSFALSEDEEELGEDEVLGEDTGSFAAEELDDDLEDDADDEVELGDEDLLEDDGFEESTNPTMVMSQDMKQDLEDMVDEGTATEEFRPQGMQEETGLIDSDDLLDSEDFLEADDSFEDEDEAQDEEEAPEPIVSQTPAPPKESPVVQTTEERIPPRFHEGEALRLQATIRQLREERESFLKEIQDLKKESKVIEQENLGLKAELDEAKIEISILKKRHNNEMDEMRYRLRLTDEKKLYAEEKVKNLQKEFDRLQSKVRVDFNHIKQREKELESQLELTKMDTESQVKSRDKKILELKRKIDQLEFNMENIVIREQKSRDDKMKLEERLDRIMKTLRGSIEVIEEDRE